MLFRIQNTHHDPSVGALHNFNLEAVGGRKVDDFIEYELSAFPVLSSVSELVFGNLEILRVRLR